MTGGNRPRSAGLQIAGGEYFSDRRAFGGEVVVAESVGLIGIVEEYRPPTPAGGLRALRDDDQFRIRAPRGAKIVGDVLLERGHGRRGILVRQNGALIDD